MKSLYYYLFIALAFVMPLWEKMVPIVILAIAANWIIEGNYSGKLLQIKKNTSNRYLLAFSGLYILYLFGSLYSNNIRGNSGALFDMEAKLSLLVFPVIFSTLDLNKPKPDIVNKTLYSFVFGCLISTFILITNAIIKYLEIGQIDAFFYAQLSMDFHPSYFSIYLNFSIAILLYNIVSKGIKTPVKKYITILAILYFETFIVLLSSKAGIISLIIILITILILLAKYNNQLINLGIVLSALMYLTLALWIFPTSYNRFFIAKDAFADDLKEVNANTDGKTSRVLIWRSSLEIIKENIMFGVGTGDVIPELKKTYESKGLAEASKYKLNAHNQYLQTAIAIGLPGIIFLLLSLFYPFILSIKRKKKLYLLFLILIIFNMLFESILERQEGVIFYTFFNVVLFSSVYKGDTRGNKSYNSLINSSRPASKSKPSFFFNL